jgi:hypothetical protein
LATGVGAKRRSAAFVRPRTGKSLKNKSLKNKSLKNKSVKNKLLENWHEGAGNTNVTAVTANGGFLTPRSRKT